jgi:hypothetical protein
MESQEMSFPGINEADLVTKAVANVVQGLKKSQQVPPWPDTRESLLELYAILDEWYVRAEATTTYARHLSSLRAASKTVAYDERYSAGSNVGPIGRPIRVGNTNIGRSYISAVERDTEKVLRGSPPLISRISPTTKRRAIRRSLRTILLTYCPELLGQFEQAAAARTDWVKEHKNEFHKWFDESRTDQEVAATLAEMTATQEALRQAKEQLRDFITANFPFRQPLNE